MGYKYTLNQDTTTMTTNTYTWRVNYMLTKDVQYMPRSVTVINYTLTGHQGEYTAEYPGDLAIGEPSFDTFTPFENLTETQVMGWVMSSFTVEELQARMAEVDRRLAEVINPPVQHHTVMPWDTTVPGVQEI